MNLRLFLAGSAMILAWNAQALAAGPDEAGGNALLRAMSHCAALTDGAARLACYDGLAPRVNAALAGEPAAVATRAPTKEEQKSWFGFDVGDLFGSSPATQTTPQQFGVENTEAARTERESPQANQIESISAGVTEYAYNPFGKFIVFLDNGQVWKQVPGDADRARFKRKAADNTVAISRGFIGSYNLSINGSNRIYKVTRIK